MSQVVILLEWHRRIQYSWNAKNIVVDADASGPTGLWVTLMIVGRHHTKTLTEWVSGSLTRVEMIRPESDKNNLIIVKHFHTSTSFQIRNKNDLSGKGDTPHNL